MSKHRVDCYYIEHNGDCWQSVFPHWQHELSQLHATKRDARDYIREIAGNVQIIERAKGG